MKVLWTLAIVPLFVAACSNSRSAQPTVGDATTTSAEAATESSRPTSASQNTSPSESTAGPATSAPPEDGGRPATEEEVIDRYLGFWAARWAANSGTPDPSHPHLAEYATGQQLATVVAETQSNLERGVSYRASEDPVDLQRIQVLSLEANEAVVQECVVDDGLVVMTASGEVVDRDVTTQSARGELVRGDDGRWRVDRVQVIQIWEGVSGCASGS